MQENKVYTFAAVQEIVRQLEAMTVDGEKVFRSVEITETGVYYDITLRNEIGSAIITLRKAL